MLIKELVAMVGIDTADFDRGAQAFLRKTHKISRAWAQAGRDISRAATRITAALGAAGAVVTKTGLSFAALKEQSQIAFAVMLRDAGKAKRLLQDLNSFAANTPFELEGILGATKTLFGFGFQLNEIMPTLRMLGDVSAGTGKDLRELATIFGQIRGLGKLQGQDFLQLVNAGFPVIEIARTMGLTMAQLRDEMSRGNVPFAAVEATFRRLTSSGGVFNNMMQRQSKTVAGLVSTLKDNFKQISARIVQPLFEEIARVLPEILKSFDTPKFQQFIKSAQQSVRDFIQSVHELAPVFMQAARTAGEFLKPLLQFLKEHPQIMGALLALKVGGFLGLNSAIMSTASALGQTLVAAISLLSNPIGAIIAAIAAATAALVLFFTKTEAGKKVFAEIKQVAEPFVDVIKSLWSILKNLASILGTVLKPVLRAVGILFGKLWELIKPLVSGGMKLLAAQILALVKPLTTVVGWLDKIISKADKAIKKIFAVKGRAVENDDPGMKALVEISEIVKSGKLTPQQEKQIVAEADRGNNVAVLKKAKAFVAANARRKAAVGRAGAPAPAAAGFGGFKLPPAKAANPRDAINKALRGAEVGALDRATPGFSQIRKFIGMPGATAQDVGRFMGTRRGVTAAQGREAGRAFGAIRGRLGGNLSPQQLDKIALSLAKTTNQIRAQAEAAAQSAEKLKQAREAALPLLDQMAFKLDGVKGKIPQAELDALNQRLQAWGNAMGKGKVTLDQLRAGMRQLASDTSKAVAAAEKKAAQERRAALLRGDFKAAGLDFRKALEDRVAQFRMAQFNRQVENAFNNMFGLNRAIKPVRDNFDGLRDNMRQFAESLPSPQRASGEQIAQLNQQIGTAFNSLAGRLQILRNEISLQAQKIPLLDTFRQKRDAVRIINRLQQQAHDLIRASMSARPAFSGMSFGNSSLVDPGLQSQPTQITNNLSFPNLTKMSNADARQMLDTVSREIARRGHSVVQ